MNIQVLLNHAENLPLAIQEDELYSLDTAKGGLGLRCEEAGLLLAGVPLLRKAGDAFTPRPAHEIEALVRGAYGRERDAIRLEAGLRVAADALNKGDVSRAMIAALHLRLPILDDQGAAGIALADEVLAKYNYNSAEPRDERGRWTTGEGGSGGAGSAGSKPRTLPAGPVGQRWLATGGVVVPSTSVGPTASPDGAPPQQPTRSWSGPVHLHDGRIVSVQDGGIGGNFPPEPIPEDGVADEPGAPRSRAPWATETSPPIGFIPGDPNYPMMRDGTLWPHATHDLIAQVLAARPGKVPMMLIYVPRNQNGPILTGTTKDQDIGEVPEGYSAVWLIGTPQVIYTGKHPDKVETSHAPDSIEEALNMAWTNQFGEIYFNRSYSMLSKNEVKSAIRADVVGVVRPGLNLEHLYHPFEVLSPGQTHDDRQNEMPNDPRVARMRSMRRRTRYSRSPYYIYYDSDHVRDI